MARFELQTFANHLELAKAAADAWLKMVESSDREGRPQHVALSGGRIAKDFFCAIAESSRERAIPLANVHFFWADERCVPPRDPESNFSLTDQFLLKPLAVSPDRIHRICGEDIPEEAAKTAEKELRRLVPHNEAGQPVLDMIFLGMGEDGHVASLFPEATAANLTASTVYLAVHASKPPPRRITLAYQMISAARQVWVLVSGSGKESALALSLSNSERTPLGRVLASRLHTWIFTDVRVRTAIG